MAGSKDKINDETEVGATELATVLGLSARRIQQMGQDGTFVTVRRGQYLLCENVQRYINFLSKPVVDDDDKKTEKAKRMAEAQIKAAKATVAKLEADELKGKMHRSEDVAAMTEDLIYTIRGAMNALPGRLAVDVASAGTAAEAAEIIRREVHKVMAELASYRYDPKKYEERVRERLSWNATDGDEDGS